MSKIFRRIAAATVAHRQIGGLHFFRVGRIGGSFYVKPVAHAGKPVTAGMVAAAAIFAVTGAASLALAPLAFASGF